MATWLQGQPYTSASADDVTTMVNGDRTAQATIDAGVDISTLTASQIGLGVIDDDPGASFASSSTLTTCLAAPLSIPANTIVAGDIYELRAVGTAINASGSNSTTGYDIELGGQKVVDRTLYTNWTIPNGALAFPMNIRATFYFEAIGASVTVETMSSITLGSSNTYTAQLGVEASKSLTAVNTTAAIAVDIKGKMSVNNAACALGILACSIIKWRR